MSEAEKIGQTIVKKVPNMENVKMESFWIDQPCVIIFFRRFGCLFCRQSAKEISTIAPQLAARNVRLIGIGMDDIGLDDFVKAGYFAGDLYIDENKETYKQMGFKRLGYLNMVTSLFNRQTKDALSKSRADGLGGDFKGDGFQNGGTLIVDQGGHETFLCYKQENPADLLPNSAILSALGMEDHEGLN